MCVREREREEMERELKFEATLFPCRSSEGLDHRDRSIHIESECWSEL